IIKRIGEYPARELMLTGQRIPGQEAERLKLVSRCFSDIHATEAYLQATLQLLLTSGPAAIGHCKNLIDTVVNKISLAEAVACTAEMIAQIRASKEGQEGMAAFLEKRKPDWVG